MTPEQMSAYVRAGAAALGIPMDEARAARVLQNFERTAAMAAQLAAAPLGLEDELAEIYRPAPFPDADAVGDTPTKAAP